jgi:hypothetical protein
MLSLIDNTIVELGGGEWSDRRIPAPRDCKLPSGKSGANYVGVTIGLASLDSDADIEKVERFRQSKRLSASVVRSTNPKDTTIRLYGTGGPVTGSSYSADSKQTSLGGESTCVPGDFGKLIDGSK